jgi:hypothetical protein
MEVKGYLGSDFVLFLLGRRVIFIAEQVLRDIRLVRLLRQNPLREPNKLDNRLLIGDDVKVVELNVSDVKSLAICFGLNKKNLNRYERVYIVQGSIPVRRRIDFSELKVNNSSKSANTKIVSTKK